MEISKEIRLKARLITEKMIVLKLRALLAERDRQLAEMKAERDAAERESWRFQKNMIDLDGERRKAIAERDAALAEIVAMPIKQIAHVCDVCEGSGDGGYEEYTAVRAWLANRQERGE